MSAELTYGEVKQAREVKILNDYVDELVSLLRNIRVTGDDYHNGMLTNEFMTSNRVSAELSKILLELTNQTKNKLKELV